jgi:hypothetical protein
VIKLAKAKLGLTKKNATRVTSGGVVLADDAALIDRVEVAHLNGDDVVIIVS